MPLTTLLYFLLMDLQTPFFADEPNAQTTFDPILLIILLRPYCTPRTEIVNSLKTEHYGRRK